MKQTAVEWFAQKLSEQGIDYPLQEFEQAKEMEKEQIKNSYKSGAIDGFNSRTVPTNPNPEQYYKETFKSE